MPENGRLDTGTLILVQGTPTLNPIYLERGTAADWFGFYNACRRELLLNPLITKPDGGYRTYARQQYWRDYYTRLGQPSYAAVPGLSNHGWGTAVDIDNTATFIQLGKYQQMKAIAGRFGFVFDVSYENWHMRHARQTLAPANLDITLLEDDMGDLERLALKNIEDKIGVLMSRQLGYGGRIEVTQKAVTDLATTVDTVAERQVGYGRRVELIQAGQTDVLKALDSIALDRPAAEVDADALAAAVVAKLGPDLSKQLVTALGHALTN